MKLGLSFFVNHLYFYGTSFSNFIFGPERTKRWAPCSLGTKYSLRWTLHQDHPTHPGPLLPFASMQTAVTRTERFQPDTVYGPEYCVSIHEALKGETLENPRQRKLCREYKKRTRFCAPNGVVGNTMAIVSDKKMIILLMPSLLFSFNYALFFFYIAYYLLLACPY